jgi:hypothetical protein
VSILEGSLDATKYTIIPYVSMTDASVQDHSTRDCQFPGLSNDTSYLWAQVDTEDGRHFWLTRTLTPVATPTFSVTECSNNRWTYPTHVKAPGDSELYWGPLIWIEDGGKSILLPINGRVSQQHPITVELGPEQYIWKEDDAFDVVLTPLPGRVKTIYVPGLPDAIGYTSSACSVTGTVDGSKVTGYGGWDRMYVERGWNSHVCKVAMLEHYWIVWGALMADGSWHTGNVWLGGDGFATATFVEPGADPVVATREAVKSRIIWDTEGDVSLPGSATLAFGGRTFNWEVSHNAVAEGPGAIVAHLHGKVQEDGGPVPVQSWSTMEIITVRAAPRDDLS